MAYLSWEQSSHKDVVIFIPEGAALKSYTFTPSIYNFLAQAKKLDIYTRIRGIEKIHQVNFSGLKLRAGAGGGKLSRNISSEQATESSCSCAFSRGEQFNDRWLGPNGWSETKYYFELEDYLIIDEQSSKSYYAPPVTVTQKLPETPPVQEPYPKSKYGNSVHGYMKSNTMYGIWLMIFSLGSILTSAIMEILVNNDINQRDSGGMFVFSWISILFTFAAVIFFLVLLSRGWKLLFDKNNPAATQTILWLLLIPFFHLYWGFKATAGLFRLLSEYYKTLRPERKLLLLRPTAPVLMMSGLMLIYFWGLLFMINYHFGADNHIPAIALFISFEWTMLMMFITGMQIKTGINNILKIKAEDGDI